MTDHDCPHAVTLRNLLDACDRGRPLADITDRLRVEVGRLGPCAAQPDRDAAIDNAVEAADGEMAQGRANFAEWRHLFLAELSGQGYEIRASGEGTAPPPDEDHGVRLVHFGCDECKQVGRVVTKLGPECLHCDLPRGHAGDCVPMVWPQPGTTPRIKPVHIDTPDDERGTAPPAADDGWIEVTPDAMARACDRAHASPNAAEVGHREGFCLACAELRVAMSGEWGTAPQVPAEVLWEGPAGDLDIVEKGRLYDLANVDVDARVRVVAADGAPHEGDERG